MQEALRLACRKVMRAGCALALGVAVLAGCANQSPRHEARNPAAGVSLVVLPKPPDGHVGSVMMRPIGGGKPVLVNRPYVEASMRDGKKTILTATVDAKSVNREFGKTLAALPQQPDSFLVYFIEGTDELKPDAKRAVDNVFVEVSTRPAPEIIVIGHTDFVGSNEYNDMLSLQRAVRVKDLLVLRGIPVKIIRTAGRGKREPLVRTSDDVVEPRNRRVEIIVR